MRLSCIREQDPLKQGLKLRILCKPLKWRLIREQDPLKQGLKLHYHSSCRINSPIREQDPLKQGLKHPSAVARAASEITFASKIH